MECITMKSVTNGKEPTLADTIGGGVCLWACLTCPSEEWWIDFMETVIEAQFSDDYKMRENLTWRVIIAYMKAHIPEA